ncbi:MAG: hypothetical protein IJV95_03215 [Clostridia bacterium]|nr:hypothetical protein [Clostridia bacterium]
MNKFFKKTVVLLLAIVCAFGSIGLMGCGDDGPKSNHVKDQKYDPNKAQLYVSNFNGGVGTEWLYRNIEKFQKEYADVKFTEDTTGVQVWVDAHKNSGTATAEKMAIEKNQIYFLGGSNYLDMVATNKLYDMTHVVKGSLYEVGEGDETGDGVVTIESKLSEDFKEYYGIGTGDSKKYYALPHYDIFSTITYDVDIFNEKSLFFDTNGQLTKKSTDAGRGTGPDGESGTYDDGLPRTYEEFFLLCETMELRGVDPIVWSGMYNFYTTEYMAMLRADYEGSELAARIKVDGTMTKLVQSLDASGNITFKAPTTISSSNAQDIFSSAGILYGLRFFDKIIDNGWYASAAVNEATSHTGAQATFLTSKYNSKTNPIGMLVEGTYWTHESADTFRSMKSRYKNSSLEERNLAVMPCPKVDETHLGKNTIATGSSICAINGNVTPGSDIAKLAELFVKYCHTNDALADFFMTTNVPRGFNYTLSEEQLSKVTPFGNSVRTLIENSNRVMGQSNSTFCYNNYTALSSLDAFASSYATDPVTALRSGVSPETIFNEIRTTTRTFKN